MWSQIIIQKYIEFAMVEEWINMSIVWKRVILVFPLVGDCLDWKFGMVK
jgi:hypothetical protein